jgi:hypothetical protein
MPNQEWLELFWQAAARADDGALPDAVWLGEEIERSALSDRWPGKRSVALTRNSRVDSADVRVAYRFLSNPRVDGAAILAGHFVATRELVHATAVPILVLHGTTQFT